MALKINTANGSVTLSPEDGSGNVAVAIPRGNLASETYVDTAISTLVDTAPDALNTLNELAAALSDDANFATTVTDSLALKAPLASPIFTGTVTIPTLDVTGDVEVTGKLSSIGNFAVGTTPGNNYQAMVYSNSGDEQLYLIQDGTGGTPLRIDNSGGSYGVWLNQYGDGTAVYIDSANTDSPGISGRFTSLTTAAAMYVYSSSNSTSARSTIDFRQTSAFATNANVLKLTQASAADALFIDMNGNGTAFNIDAFTSTAPIVKVVGDQLQTGNLAQFYSNSSHNGTRNLVEVINDNTGATGTTALYIKNDSTGKAIDAIGDVDVTGTVTATSYTDTVYALSGTEIDPANGGIQTKTLSGATTFTEVLSSGESVILMIDGGDANAVTWPTITWVTSAGNAAPTLTANDTIVLWKVSTTLYGAYTGSYT